MRSRTDARGSQRHLAILASALAWVLAGAASAGIPALDLEGPPSGQRAAVVHDDERIIVQNPITFAYDDWLDPAGFIRLPPHPGGELLSLDCSTPWDDCFHLFPSPRGMNAAGEIVGAEVTFGTLACCWPVPAYWSPEGALHLLLALDPGRETATRIASGGRIIGFNYNNGSMRIPLTWEDRFASYEALPGFGTPLGLNSKGVVVGETFLGRAVRWQRLPLIGWVKTLLPPGHGGTQSSRAADINEARLIVGTASRPDGEHAIVWTSPEKQPVNLPVPFPGGTCEQAVAVNEAGLVAGTCTTSGGEPRGVVWRVLPNEIFAAHILDPLPGHIEIGVGDLNDTGVVVGWSVSGQGAWPSPVMWRLGTLPSQDLPGPGSLLGLALLIAGVLALRAVPRQAR